MRTALILLFLFALASLPGALLPQWNLDRGKTAQFIIDHPRWGRLLDATGFFSVFGSPWYAAIYLLLFTSLVGCLVPRSVELTRQLRRPPVVTPRNLVRMPHFFAFTTSATPDDSAAKATAVLGRRWRIRRDVEADGAVTISAERGYLREVGNVVFHLSLLGLLVAVAVGKLVGYEGSIIVDTQSGFCSVGPVSYDNFRPGILVDGTQMSPFCVNVENFRSAYTAQGQASEFAATIRYQSGSDVGTGRWSSRVLQVNDPLRISGQRLYLLGHGFTPHFRVKYPSGAVRDYAQPFQPMDSTLVSQGAVKITDPPDWNGTSLLTHQLALVGVFAPTQRVSGGVMTSVFPAARDPGVAVQVYRGDLGLEIGRPQSVFAIDSAQVASGLLVKVKQGNLSPGQTLTLDDGTVITFTGYNEWVSLQTSYDPGQLGALISAIALLVGLTVSLTIKRRRVWFRFRATADATGEARTDVEVGGLARTDAAGYGEEFSRLVRLTV
ncbi:cytochrome c biogenesis protein [Nakamurella endophytica]|uniref:Cytochrome c biogenesis protein n=2 Tax=Nakamurella endophytica TaxID=1748367 RepID=A0A917WP75_9ACTN|nr:cytochrome c biogenesis protein [Nakamurella endophytica]